MGNTTVKSGQRFTGVVPPPLVPSEEIMNGAGFMHPLERFGPSDLKAVLAFRVNSGMTPRSVHLRSPWCRFYFFVF
jgi:hypothetical protein